MQAIARLARQRGHQRVDWTADRNNDRLLTFYESLGAYAQEDKVFFRLTGSALDALAEAKET